MSELDVTPEARRDTPTVGADGAPLVRIEGVELVRLRPHVATAARSQRVVDSAMP